MRLSWNLLFHWEADPCSQLRNRHREIRPSTRTQGFTRLKMVTELRLDKAAQGWSHREQPDPGSGGLLEPCLSGDTVPTALGSL